MLPETLAFAACRQKNLLEDCHCLGLSEAEQPKQCTRQSINLVQVRSLHCCRALAHLLVHMEASPNHLVSCHASHLHAITLMRASLYLISSHASKLRRWRSLLALWEAHQQQGKTWLAGAARVSPRCTAAMHYCLSSPCPAC